MKKEVTKILEESGLIPGATITPEMLDQFKRELGNMFGDANHMIPIMNEIAGVMRHALQTKTPMLHSLGVEVDGIEVPLIRLWIGIGSDSVFDRIRQLREQNEELVAALMRVKDWAGLSEEIKAIDLDAGVSKVLEKYLGK